MPPKRSKSEKDRGGGKRARVSGNGGWEQAKDVQVSEGITERQLASFSEVSAKANTSRILQAQQDLASNSHAGLNSLLAAAGAQAAPSAAPNVLGEYNAAIQLFQLQQGANVAHAFPAGFTPHALGGVPPTGIPVPIGNVHDISTIGLGQSAAFGQNTLQSLLTAQMAVQSSASNVLQLPQYALQPGAGALPSMVSLKSQGPGKSSLSSPGHNAVTPLTAKPAHTIAKAVIVEGAHAHEHKHTNGSVCSVGSSSGAARADGSTTSTTRSHGPSADRYSTAQHGTCL